MNSDRLVRTSWLIARTCCWALAAATCSLCASLASERAAPVRDLRTLWPDQLGNQVYAVSKLGGRRASGESSWDVRVWNDTGGWSLAGSLRTDRTCPLEPVHFTFLTGGQNTYAVAMCQSMLESEGRVWVLGRNADAVHSVGRPDFTLYAVDQDGRLLAFQRDSIRADETLEYWKMEVVAPSGLHRTARYEIKPHDSTLSQYGAILPSQVFLLQDGRWLCVSALPPPHEWGGDESVWEWLHFWVTDPDEGVVSDAQTVRIADVAISSWEYPQGVTFAMGPIEFLGADSSAID